MCGSCSCRNETYLLDCRCRCHSVGSRPPQNYVDQVVRDAVANRMGELALTPYVALPYTVATLPSAAANPAIKDGSIVYCLDGNAGQPCLAVNSGGVWHRVALGAAVSIT